MKIAWRVITGQIFSSICRVLFWGGIKREKGWWLKKRGREINLFFYFLLFIFSRNDIIIYILFWKFIERFFFCSGWNWWWVSSIFMMFVYFKRLSSHVNQFCSISLYWIHEREEFFVLIEGWFSIIIMIHIYYFLMNILQRYKMKNKLSLNHSGFK